MLSGKDDLSWALKEYISQANEWGKGFLQKGTINEDPEEKQSVGCEGISEELNSL